MSYLQVNQLNYVVNYWLHRFDFVNSTSSLAARGNLNMNYSFTTLMHLAILV